MASKSPWSDLDLNDPATLQRLASAGTHALQSGKVSPEDAQAMAESMGITKKGSTQIPPAAQMPGEAAVQPQGNTPQNPIAMGVMPQQDNNPLSMTAASRWAQQNLDAIPGRIGARASDTQTNQMNFKRSSNRLFNRSPDDIRAMKMQAQGVYPEISDYEQAVGEDGKPLFDPRTGAPIKDKDHPMYNFDKTSIDEEDPVRQQQKGLSRMEDLLKMQAESNQQRNTMDFTPLAALADAVGAQNGHPSALAASSPKPEDRAAQFMTYADEIQKRKADIQKAIAEGIKAQRGGSTTDLLAQAMIDKNMVGQQNPTRDYQAQMDMQKLRAQDAQAARAHQQVLNKMSGDKQLQNDLQTYNGLGSGLSIIKNSDHVTPQIVDEAQQAIKQAMSLGRGTNGGVGEREKGYMNTVGMSERRLQEILSGKPADMAKDDEVVQHLKNLAAIEQQNVNTIFERRLNAVSAGAGWIYNNPRYQPGGEGMDFKSSLEDALEAQKAQFGKAGATPLKGGAATTRRVTQAPRTPSGGLAPVNQASVVAGPNPTPNSGVDPIAAVQAEMKRRGLH